MGSVPDWPRSMRRVTAARYLDMAPTEFDREVSSGRLPTPFRLDGKEHWSRASLDECVAELAGETVDDWRSKQPAYAQA